jgi:hypothetical protein
VGGGGLISAGVKGGGGLSSSTCDLVHGDMNASRNTIVYIYAEI